MSECHYYDSTHNLREVVQNRLGHHACVMGRNFRIEMEQDAIVLKGTVSSYYHKQLAQESVRSLEGVENKTIRNELEVISPEVLPHFDTAAL